MPTTPTSRRRWPLSHASVAERKAYAQLMRSRLQEVSATMNTRLPLYVTFTKLDLLRGFDVIYQQLDKEAREAVLGVTFNPSDSQGKSWQQELALFWDQWVDNLNQNLPELMLAVNVSPRQFHLTDLAGCASAALADSGFPARLLELEITETALAERTEEARQVLVRLRELGVRIAVDDFGTGYSSLSQLSQIPFTELKIDRGFVSGAPTQPRKRAMIETSLDLARKLDLCVVAEGVETIEEWQLLAQLGCDYAQGYLISAPVPGEQLPDAIQRWRQTHH